MEYNSTIKNRELVEHAKRIVRKAAADKRPLTFMQLCEEVQRARPLHFYVGYDRAVMILKRIERHGVESTLCGDESRAMWLDLSQQVREIMSARPRLTFAQALTQALYFSRPQRFYMTVAAIKRVLGKHFTYVLTPAVDFENKKYC